MLKAFDLGLPPGLEVWESKPPNRGASQIEAFTIKGHSPRMLKTLNSMSWAPKTSNSKVLTYWSHLSGWLDAKSFDLGWPSGLEVWGSKNIQIKTFTIQEHDPRMLKLLKSRFWGSKTSNSKFLTSCGHLSGWLDAKSFDLGWPPVWMFGDPKTFKTKL